MSHTIIIRNRSASTGTPNPVEAEVTYTPDHSLSPAEAGNEVAKIMRKLDKLCDAAETGE